MEFEIDLPFTRFQLYCKLNCEGANGLWGGSKIITSTIMIRKQSFVLFFSRVANALRLMNLLTGLYLYVTDCIAC